MCPAQDLLYFERTSSKWDYPECACFERSRNNVNFTKTCVLKEGCVAMRKYA